MKIDTTYDLGDIVYLKTDPDQKERMITGITIRFGITVVYLLSAGSEESYHYSQEMTINRDVLKATSE